MTLRNLQPYFKPRRVLALGSPTGPQATALLQRLQAESPTLLTTSLDDLGTDPGVLAVVADPAALNEAVLARLASHGCRTLIWPHTVRPDVALLQAARRHTTRLLGPRSPGILHPAHNLAAADLPGALSGGSLALIVQSQSIASAAIDWATGRHLGFSWVAVTGGESDVDIADLLDYAALDPATRAVAVEVGRIRGARKFMSAARACARAKPVVVLQTRQADWSGKGPDPVRSAAFARAGMVECLSLPALFDAFAALHRLPPLHRARVLVVSNGSGICALGVDAVLRNHLRAADPAPAAWERMKALVPALKKLGGGADIGDPGIATTIAALHAILSDPEAQKDVDVVLYIRSPIGPDSHEAVARALAAAHFDERLLTVWLGLETASPARSISAEAGLSTFTSADAASRAVRYRWEYGRNRELLTQTPPRGPTAPINAATSTSQLQRLLARGETEPAGTPGITAGTQLLAAYGLPSRAAKGGEVLRLDVRIQRHTELGTHLALSLAVPGFTPPTGYAFAPLDPLLARRLLTDAGLRCDSQVTSAMLDALAMALIRIGQLALDQPLLATLHLRLLAQGESVACEKQQTRLQLDPNPPPERARLALAPYPSALAHELARNGSNYQVRPIRPDDEPALLRLLEGLDPETVRLRFFAYIRHFSHDLAARMTQIDYDRELALVIFPAGSPDHLVGIGTLAADPDNASAEFGVLVDKAHVGQGLGRHLLEQFLAHAKAQGIASIFGEVLAENTPMLNLARRLGFKLHAMADDPGVVHVELKV